MNRRNFLRNLAMATAAVTASPLLVKAMAKAPASAVFTCSAKIDLPPGPRYHTVWITFEGKGCSIENFSGFIEEIRIKQNGRLISRIRNDNLGFPAGMQADDRQ